jgi:3-phosphoshikimate 1-carboxyvinyltransferase
MTASPVPNADPAAPRVTASRRAGRLSGNVTVPGDKSISHRALIMGALAVGETTVTGLLLGEDVLRTAAVMAALGAQVENGGTGVWKVKGRGIGGLTEPADVLDMGNSGTGARLIAGVLAAYPFTSVMTGDASLRKRPMQRVITPLSQTGAKFMSRAGGRLPMAVSGSPMMLPLNYESPVASAQVKSAVLLAGLHAAGATTLIEPAPTRDHTERMFRHFGVEVESTALPGGANKVRIIGRPELTGRAIVVPADPSSAAFAVVAALIVPGSTVTLRNVGMNPLRTGLFDTLMEMGADIAFTNTREEAGEPVADLVVRSSKLKGVNVPAARAPSMIDEYPILAVAAAFADGETRMDGLAELRVKESDRLALMANGLVACGVKARADGDALIVQGGAAKGHATIAVHLDHRIAMSFLVLGMAAEKPVAVDDASAIATSFPGFIALMNGLGASIADVPATDMPPVAA